MWLLRNKKRDTSNNVGINKNKNIAVQVQTGPTKLDMVLRELDKASEERNGLHKKLETVHKKINKLDKYTAINKLNIESIHNKLGKGK